MWDDIVLSVAVGRRAYQRTKGNEEAERGDLHENFNRERQIKYKKQITPKRGSMGLAAPRERFEFAPRSLVNSDEQARLL